VYIFFVLLIDLSFLFVESVDDLIHIISHIVCKSCIERTVPSCEPASRSSASFFNRVMWSRAYWMLLKRSFPFILTSNKYSGDQEVILAENQLIGLF
jgi:hypothetical protein